VALLNRYRPTPSVLPIDLGFMRDRVFRQAPQMVWTTYGDEAVVFNVERSTHEMLNGVATRVWELLAQPTTLDAIVEVLREEYAMPYDEARERVLTDVASLLVQLATKSIVVSEPKDHDASRTATDSSNAANALRGEAIGDPTNPLPLYRLAQEYRRLGDLTRWRDVIRIALTLPHHTPLQRFHRGFAKMAMDDWSGWADFESRALLPEMVGRRALLAQEIVWECRAWDGMEDIQNETLFVLPEQGIGDMIQMLRFIPLVARRAKSVVVGVHPRLVPFVQHNFGNMVDLAIDGVEKPLAFDRYVWAMSLPAIVGCLPPFEPMRSPRRRPPLNGRRRTLRGGICWAGNPEYVNDWARSMPADHIAPLLDRRDIEWFSLQVGPSASDAEAYPSLMRPWPRLITFGDTADLIADLDVVVSVDTAVAHLAGCLAVPTLLLLPTCADSRWGMSDRTPWYPSVRLVRQPADGDWCAVIRNVQHALDDLSPRSGSVSA
jgi:hypothetical protein